MVGESAVQRPGQQAVLSRITEALFVEVLRSWIGSLGPGEEGGWLGAMADPHIGRALQLIHELPERPWTLRELGRHAGLGRSAFSARFTRLVGQPVHRYLVARRMDEAALMLASSDDAIARIAARVGYETTTAFSKAFHQLRFLSQLLPARKGGYCEGWKETSRRTDRTGMSGRRRSWRRMGPPTRGYAIDSGCGPGARSALAASP